MAGIVSGTKWVSVIENVQINTMMQYEKYNKI